MADPAPDVVVVGAAARDIAPDDPRGWRLGGGVSYSALTTARLDRLPPVTPVLCFVGADWPLFSPPREFMGVRLESERSIKKAVSEPVELDPEAIDQLAFALARVLPAK